MDAISAQDVHDYIYKTKGKFDVPLVINGKILNRNRLIEECDIADDEVLMYEIAWETDSKNLRFGFAPE